MRERESESDAGDEYVFSVSRGVVELRRQWSGDGARPSLSRRRRTLTVRSVPVLDEYPGSKTGMSSKSRNNMMRTILSLPLEMLGLRPVLITLTFPGKDWRTWVPNGRVLENLRKAFERQWVRKWGEPMIGFWVKEFQK